MISIVIPTFNREKELKATIDSLLRQSYINYEVFVVDNGPSTDGTKHIVEAYDDPRIQYVSTTRKGCIFARNIGAEKAKGEILLTLDDDIEFFQDNELILLIKTFSNDPEIGIVGSIELNSPTESFSNLYVPNEYQIGRIDYKGNFNTSFSLLSGRGITEVDHVRSAFMAIRSKLFHEVGGFEEIYNAQGMGFRYESDFCLKVKKAGYKVVVNPDIRIWHKGAKRKRGFRRGKGIKYFYYANRNHNFFMNKFFWKMHPVWNLYDLFIGTSRTPGLSYGIQKLIKEKEPRIMLWLLASLAGKFAGLYKSIRFL